MRVLATRGGESRARDAWETGGWLQLFTGVAFLPFRALGLSLELMARAAQEVQRVGERRPELSPSYCPQGTGAITASAKEAVTSAVEFHNREENKMSFDKDLSGTDLKIVEYSIVSVDPDLEDYERVLDKSETIATSDDMTESDFTSWVIAKFIQDNPHKIDQKNKQYLRVSYYVQCRMSIPDANYERKQARALEKISKTLEARLPGDGGGKGESPAAGTSDPGSTPATGGSGSAWSIPT